MKEKADQLKTDGARVSRKPTMTIAGSVMLVLR